MGNNADIMALLWTGHLIAIKLPWLTGLAGWLAGWTTQAARCTLHAGWYPRQGRHKAVTSSRWLKSLPIIFTCLLIVAYPLLTITTL
jgi:hypothetical protein